MPDGVNSPPCPTHGVEPRALHEHNFQGIVTVIDLLIATASGMGSVSYSRCPAGYPWNFEGVVRALEDLNTTLSGVPGGGGVGPSGYQIIGDGGTSVNISGNYYVVSSVAGPFAGSGVPSDPWNGSLWYKQDQGRLFVYASGENALGSGGWYQTNAEPIVYKSEAPPSGTGDNAPMRDGFLWYNTDLGNLLVYDAVSSGWYESGPRRDLAFRSTEPSAAVAGEAYFDSASQIIRVWNGSEWVSNVSSVLPSVTTTTTAATILTSYSAASPGTRTYTINIERGGEVQTSDIKFINNATDVYTSEFAVVYSSGFLASFSGALSGSTVNLLAFSNTADPTTFRPIRITP